MNWQRYPFSSAFNNRPDASPVLPTPGGPLRTRFSALATNSNSARVWICLRLTRPVLGKSGTLDSPRQRGLLAMMPLGPQQAGEELGVGDVLLLGGAQLFAINIQDAVEVKALQQLFQLVTWFHGWLSGSLFNRK